MSQVAAEHMSKVAGWLGKTADEAYYANVSATILSVAIFKLCYNILSTLLVYPPIEIPNRTSTFDCMHGVNVSLWWLSSCAHMHDALLRINPTRTLLQ
jgi:hypothetical protein